MLKIFDLLNFTDYLILFFSGCIGGIIAGLLGVGGGIINVFILTFFADKLGIVGHEQVRFILANSLFAIFFSSVFGSIQQIKNKNFYFKEVGIITLTAVASNMVISYTILRYDWYSKERFSIFFVIILVLLAAKMTLTLSNHKKKQFSDSIRQNVLTPLGLMAGLFSALTGLGGGVIMVPYMSDIFNLKIKKATSISLGVMPFMTISTSLLYAFFENGQNNSAFGYIYPGVVIPMTLGVMISAPLGVKLAGILSDKVIRIAFILIILIVISRMLSRIF